MRRFARFAVVRSFPSNTEVKHALRFSHSPATLLPLLLLLLLLWADVGGAGGQIFTGNNFCSYKLYLLHGTRMKIHISTENGDENFCEKLQHIFFAFSPSDNLIIKLISLTQFIGKFMQEIFSENILCNPAIRTI